MSEYLNTCLQFFRAINVDWAAKEISVPYFVEDVVISSSLSPEAPSYMPDVNTVFIDKARSLIRQARTESRAGFSVTGSRQDKILTMKEESTGCVLTLQAGDSVEHGIKVSLGYGDSHTLDYCQISFGVYPDEVRWSMLELHCPLDVFRAVFPAIAGHQSSLPSVLRSCFTLMGYGSLFDEIQVLPHDPEKAWYGTEDADLSVKVMPLKDDEEKVFDRVLSINLQAKAYQSFRSIPPRWEILWNFMKARFTPSALG